MVVLFRETHVLIKKTALNEVVRHVVSIFWPFRGTVSTSFAKKKRRNQSSGNQKVEKIFCEIMIISKVCMFKGPFAERELCKSIDKLISNQGGLSKP